MFNMASDIYSCQMSLSFDKLSARAESLSYLIPVNADLVDITTDQ